MHVAWKVIDQFVAQNILKKKDGKIYGEDLLTSYMKDSNEGEDDKFLRDTTVNLMLAGRDTTGVALAWFFWLLEKNPKAKATIREELKQLVLGKEEACSNFPIVFNPEELAKLVYLHGACCETLRLFPSIPFEHKETLHDEVLPSGAKTKAKEKIVFSAYSMGRMEGVWGRDCLEFKPERWISEQG